MFDFLLSPQVVPFAMALGLVTGLLLIEIVALLIGVSVLGKDFGKPLVEADLGAGFGVDLSVDTPDIALPGPADIAQMDLGGLAPADLDLGPAAAAAAPDGLAAVLGFGKVPALIWLAAALAGFGLAGYLLQSLVARIFGAPLPALLAVLPAAAAGLWFARAYARILMRLIPTTETSARSTAILSRKRGVVSQGTARDGQPAEVRVIDARGNLHFIRAEPLDRTDAITEGREVLVVRVLKGPARGQFRIVALSD